MKPLFKRPGPLLQMTLALVGLCGTLVLLADLFFGVLPDADTQALRLRRTVAEALAVQVAALLEGDNERALKTTLDGVASRTEGLRSLAVRRSDGELLAQAGNHDGHWQPSASDASVAEQLTVPLMAGSTRWGSVEMAFLPVPGHPVLRFLRQPLVVMLGFLSTAGLLVFGLYMRRALQHLDPSAVIPERVQGAFDAMAEGVVVLDARGRVLLANRSFRALDPEAAALLIGKPLSGFAWLVASLPAEAAAHPWSRAIALRTANAGQVLDVDRGSPNARRLVVNCAPITDPSGHVRGCMTTFNDVSELHRANAALLDAMGALSAAKDEVQRQNTALGELAMRDPLTGCLNRRAFRDAFDAALRDRSGRSAAIACVLLDIDRFKAVNDGHGHGVGDRVIQEVAKALRACARVGDFVCRYGGEEFCVVLPGVRPDEALAFAERLRARVERECGAAVHEVAGLHVTVSLGVAASTDGAESAAVLIDRADQAMYRAKREGRNRVVDAADAATPVEAGA